MNSKIELYLGLQVWKGPGCRAAHIRMFTNQEDIQNSELLSRSYYIGMIN